MRRAVHAYDGSIFGDRSVVRLGKGRIDSILNELAAILNKPDFFADGAIGINCASGFIEFSKAGEPSLKPHSPNHGCRHVLPARWPVKIDDITAARSFLGRLLGGCFRGDTDAKQKIDLLSEIAGCAALGYATKLIKPKAVVLKGETAENGKSQALDILRGLLPEDACTSIPLGKFGDEKYLIKLPGKLLNASDELTSAAGIASDTFKQVVTGEPITARDLYKSIVTFRPTAQHIFATNDLPTFKGGMDRGVQRRLLVLTFNRVIPERERIEHIGHRIATEEPDLLLDWAVKGASRLIKQRRFTEPDSSKVALRDWLLGADPVQAWLEEAVTVVPGKEAPKVKTSDAYKAFKDWAIEAGFDQYRLPRVSNFTQRLLAAGKGITNSRDGKGRYLVGLKIHGHQATAPRRSASK
jgi:P4 family phage/plasmid primase-like protien